MLQRSGSVRGSGAIGVGAWNPQALYLVVVGALVVLRLVLIEHPVGSLAYLGVGAVTVAAVWAGPRWSGCASRPWDLLGTGFSLIWVGDVLWVWATFWDGPATVAPMVLYSAGYVAVLVAVAVVVRRRVPRRHAASLLDAAIVGVAVVAVLWEVRFQHLAASGSVEKVVGVAWMASDLMMLVLAFELAGRRPRNRSLVLLALAAAALAAGHVTVNVINDDVTGYASWFDPLWMASFGLLGAALLDPSLRSATEPVEEAPTERYPRSALAVLGLAMATPAALVGAGAIDDGERVLVAVALFALAGLLLVRVAGLLDDQAEAHRLAAARRLAEQLRAQTDPLTGLATRDACLRRIQDAIDAGRGGALAVALLDIDRFGFVNDSLGHSTADEVLRTVATRLRRVVRDGDLIGRFGGDEFCFVLVGHLDPAVAAAAMGRVLDALREPIGIEGQTLHLTGTAGLAMPEPGDTARVLVGKADAAVRVGKSTGRGTVAAYHQAMGLEDEQRLAARGRAFDALDRGELRLHYQPQLDLATGQTTGVEALLRWQHPERGLTGPGEVLAVAEDSGLIERLGDWVLQTAIGQAAAWQASLGASAPRVSINVSPTQMRRVDVAATVAACIEQHGVDPRRLCLEVTETAVMGESRTITSQLARVRDLGVDVALDDFGTGFASLLDLRDLPVSEIKVDVAFVQALPGSPRDRGIVAAIVGLAHSMGAAVMAEGVETWDQRSAVAELGCDGAQGFLFAPALAAGEVEQIIRAERAEVMAPR